MTYAELEAIPDTAIVEERSRWECFCLIPSQTRRLYANGKFSRWQSFRLVVWAAWHRLPLRIRVPVADSFNGRNSGSQPANTGSTPVSATTSGTPIFDELFPQRGKSWDTRHE